MMHDPNATGFRVVLRFLHTADWQIGRSYPAMAATHPDNAVALAEARLDTVARLAELARDRGAHFVVVAGDVLDAQTVADRTLRRLFHAMAAFTGPWLLLPGNHDAALAESVWTRVQRLGLAPCHVHLLLKPEVLTLPTASGEVAVLPAPLTQRHTHQDLTAWFDKAPSPSARWRIGVAHGAVQGVLPEDIDSANPIAPQRAASASLDYLALGDWHGCKAIDARTWYSGTPEPERFKDNGAGLALWVEIAAPGEAPVVTPLPTARFRWQAWDHVLNVPSDLDGVLLKLAALSEADVLSLRLSGVWTLQMQQRFEAAVAQADGVARHVAVDSSGLKLAPTDEELADLQADGYVGEVLAELRQEASADTPQSPVAQEALAILAGLLSELRGFGEGQTATVAPARTGA